MRHGESLVGSGLRYCHADDALKESGEQDLLLESRRLRLVDLPPELLDAIASRTTQKESICLGSTCKLLYDICWAYMHRVSAFLSPCTAAVYMGLKNMCTIESWYRYTAGLRPRYPASVAGREKSVCPEYPHHPTRQTTTISSHNILAEYREQHIRAQADVLDTRPSTIRF